MTGLPQGWASATLAELGNWSSGGTPNRANPSYFGGDIPFVKTGDLRDKTLTSVDETLTASGLANSSAKVFPAGTLLIAMYGATIGRTARLSFDAATNQACAALLENNGNSESIDFIWKYLKSQTEALKAAGKGGAQPNISQTVLKEFPIPLPPLPEQRRIVRKLDIVSARTTTAHTHLTAIVKLVGRYRSAVLKSAFGGLLTAEWRAECGITISAAMESRSLLEHQRSALIENAAADRKRRSAKLESHRTLVVNLLPPEWSLVNMEDVTSPVRLIQYGILMPGDNVEGGVPYVKVMNVKGGRVELEKIRHTTQKIHKQYARSSIQTGDLLLTIRGTVGRMAFVPEELNGGNITQDTVRIDVLDAMNANFLYWYFHSPQAQKYFQENQKGVAVRGINVGDIRPMEVPLPGRDEQDEIVRRIETAFGKIDHLKSEAEKGLKLLGQLDQRILAKAFAGELVPQNPNDEPAETLLARIREARATAPGARRGRKPSTL